MRRFLTIGRSIDLGYPTNRAIAIAVTVVALAGVVFQWVIGARFFPGAVWGLSAGAAVFFAWALCRELDPDFDLSAFVAAALALFGLLWGHPDLLVLLWMIMAMRVVNRTSGALATVLDELAVIGLSGWLVWDRGNWIFGAAAGAAFLMDGLMTRPNRKELVFAVAALFGTGAWVIVTDTWWSGRAWSAATVGAMAVMILAFAPVIAQSRRMRAVGDRTGETLFGPRVQMAQILALSTGAQIGLWNGPAGLRLTMPLWAAVIGAVGHRFLVLPLLARFSIGQRGD